MFVGRQEQGIEDEEKEEESATETASAYEDDLRDYLTKNLSKIEPGLKLFADSEGREGIECAAWTHWEERLIFWL